MTRPALLALLTPLTLILACGDKDSSDDPSGDDSAVTACGDADEPVSKSFLEKAKKFFQ